MQLGFKGKVTNGAEKLSSKPIFMSAFPPAIRADKHLMGERKKRKGAGKRPFHSFIHSDKYAFHDIRYCSVQTLLGGES